MMLVNNVLALLKNKQFQCFTCRLAALQKFSFSQQLETKYTNEQKDKILQVINDEDLNKLSGYDITKIRLKKFSQWKSSNGLVKSISDVEMIEGFTERTAKRLFDSILEGPSKLIKSLRIKGTILQPHLSEDIRKNCKTVLSVYISVNSVCWTLVDRMNYEVQEWQYYGIQYPEGKKFQITDILDIACNVIRQLPTADIYVMKAEATTLRAAGSDPNNPKVIAVNLQKAQMVAMIVALIHARRNYSTTENLNHTMGSADQRIYFLRPTLPFRLFGTLIGNEKVATDQTVEILLEKMKEPCMNKSHAYIPEKHQNMFRSQRDLQKDMLGQCLLLCLTFMDICIYKNQESVNKLAKRGE